jgi:hypothetical protein
MKKSKLIEMITHEVDYQISEIVSGKNVTGNYLMFIQGGEGYYEDTRRVPYIHDRQKMFNLLTDNLEDAFRAVAGRREEEVPVTGYGEYLSDLDLYLISDSDYDITAIAIGSRSILRSEILELVERGRSPFGIISHVENIYTQYTGPKVGLKSENSLDEIRSGKTLDNLDLETLNTNFNKYLESINRSEMFDNEGAYNTTIQNYLKQYRKFADPSIGTDEEQLVANHILGLF